MSKKDIIKEIKNKQMPVVIYGAGIVGETLLALCRNEGITVECFCDSSKKVAQSNFCGLEVIYSPDLKTKYRDVIFLISVAAIKDVVERLHDLEYSNWYAGGLLLNDLDFSQTRFDAPFNYAKYAIETCILCHKAYLNPDKLSIRSIDIIITERCSLRCRDCSNLMQYYEKPGNCDTDMLLKSIDAFCTVIDEVIEFRIIGGEAFMNKEWHIITKRLLDEPKAKRVVVYTNGTIVPKAEYISVLKKDKALVNITDYGILSRKLVELKQILDRNNVAYYVVMASEWLDCSAIMLHNRNIEQKRKIYKNCCAKNMLTLSDGKLYRCPYAANAARLLAVPDNKDDYIDLFQKPLDDETNVSEMKEKVKDYLLHKDYLETCDYCNGRPLSGSEVQSAVQTDKPVEYYKYIKDKNVNNDTCLK
ncbi:MAG: hypothetical protein PHE49_01500 [bacterium]|nr:hypothetical protein [bacterium]